MQAFSEQIESPSAFHKTILEARVGIGETALICLYV